MGKNVKGSMQMRKIKTALFLSALVIPSSLVLGGEQSNDISETTKIEVVGQDVLANTDRSKMENVMTTSMIQEYLEVEGNFNQYTKLLPADDETPISYGVAAKVLCMYIRKAPISLPTNDGGESGYIGRLVLEGIWGEESLNINESITKQSWERLYHNAIAYQADPTAYESNYLNNIEVNKGKRIKSYKQVEKELGKKDGIELGTLSEALVKAQYDEVPIKLYQHLGINYIALQDIATLGLQTHINNEKVQITYSEKAVAPQSTKDLNKAKVSFSTQDVYIGNLRTYALTTGDKLLIPLEALEEYYHITKSDIGYIINDRLQTSSNYIKMDKDVIINQTDQNLNIQLINLYWNGEKIIEEVWGITQLLPGEIYPNQNKVYTLNSNRLYLTTIVQKITVQNEILWYTPEYYGQANSEILSHYMTTLKKREQEQKYEKTLQELFPPSIIMATMKYDVAPFKKGEQVEVYRADSNEYYYLHHGKEIIKVPWNSVKVPSNPRVETKQATIEQLEAYINSTGLTSDTDYLVWTDLYRQMTYIFKKQQGKWRILTTRITANDKEPRAAILKCSTGHNITPTPRGTYKLRAYVPAFGMNKGYMCKTATQIFGDYLYHSIMFDKTGSYTLEGKGVLGQRASQGCIRFSPEESEWFYNTLPLKTTVWIN